MFSKVDHFAFAVKDPDKSAAFYKKYFGFQKIYEEEVPLPYFQKAIYIKLHDTILELFKFEAEIPEQIFHFCLYSDDFDRDFAHLISEGVSVDTEPRLVQTGDSQSNTIKKAVIAGPDGELIELRGLKK